MKVLYVITGQVDQRPFLSCIKSHKPTQVYLCPTTYRSQKLAENLRSEVKKNISLEIIPFSERFNTTAFSERSEFLRMIYDIGHREVKKGVSIRASQRVNQNGMSGWWFSGLSEQNPFQTDTHARLWRLVTIMDQISSLGINEVWMDRQDSILEGALRKAFRNIQIRFFQKNSLIERYKFSMIHLIFREQLRALKCWCEFSWRWISLRIKRVGDSRRFRGLRDGGMVAVTMFPYLNWGAAANGKFENKAYGVLQESLVENGIRVSWIAMYAPIDATRWSDATSLARQCNQRGENIIFEEEFLQLSSLIRVSGGYFKQLVKTLWHIRKYRKLFHWHFRDKFHVDLWPIFLSDFVTSFAGRELMAGLFHYHAFEKLIECLKAPSTVLYFAEMHGWENALNWWAAQRSHVKTVGMQHTIVPLLLFTYFQDPREFKQTSSLDQLPQPDFLGCVGEITKKLFQDNGWDSKKLFTLGAFRFHGALGKRREKVSDYSKRKKIIVPLSISNEENDEMLQWLYDAFNNDDIPVRVMLKPHPLNPIDERIKRLGLMLNPNVFETTDELLQALVPGSAMLIVKESSSVFWAIHHHIPVVVPCFFNIADLCPLSGLSNLAIYVHSPEALRLLSVKIVQGGYCVEKERYDAFIQDYFHVYPSKENYLSNLMSALETGKKQSSQQSQFIPS